MHLEKQSHSIICYVSNSIVYGAPIYLMGEEDLAAKLIFCNSCSHLMGEDLESLNLKELQQLEKQLQRCLAHVAGRG